MTGHGVRATALYCVALNHARPLNMAAIATPVALAKAQVTNTVKAAPHLFASVRSAHQIVKLSQISFALVDPPRKIRASYGLAKPPLGKIYLF